MEDHDELDIFDSFDLPIITKTGELERRFKSVLIDEDVDRSGLKQYLIDRIERVGSNQSDGIDGVVIDLQNDMAGTCMFLTVDERSRAVRNVKMAAKQAGLRVQVLPDDCALHLNTDHQVGSRWMKESEVESVDQVGSNGVGEPLSGSTDCSDTSPTMDEWKGVVLVRQPVSPNTGDKTEVRVCVIGNVDAGKSTTLGVLTTGIRDNGRGKVRVNLFRYKHEVESGRTSSVGSAVLGFDDAGSPVYPGRIVLATRSPLTRDAKDSSHVDILERSAKVISFSDLAGHQKYVRTTVYGLTASRPDHCILMVGANQGLIGMAKEHLGLALTLGLSVIVVITKLDMAPEKMLRQTRRQIAAAFKSADLQHAPVVREVDGFHTCVDVLSGFVDRSICPVFTISNVTGHNVGLLRFFLSMLQPVPTGRQDQHGCLDITESFTVPFVGTVVSGIVRSGKFKLNDQVTLGPTGNGTFIRTSVRSIHILRKKEAECVAGQSAAIALRNVPIKSVHRGMVLQPFVPVDGRKAGPEMPSTGPVELKSYWTFVIHMTVLRNASNMVSNYQAMVYVGAVEQMCAFFFPVIEPTEGESEEQTTDNRRVVRGGDQVMALCRFLNRPEFVQPDEMVIIREGKTKAIGRVVEAGYDATKSDLQFEKSRKKMTYRARKTALRKGIAPWDEHGSVSSTR